MKCLCSVIEGKEGFVIPAKQPFAFFCRLKKSSLGAPPSSYFIVNKVECLLFSYYHECVDPI